jgi:hypothetical protein
LEKAVVGAEQQSQMFASWISPGNVKPAPILVETTPESELTKLSTVAVSLGELPDDIVTHQPDRLVNSVHVNLAELQQCVRDAMPHLVELERRLGPTKLELDKVRVARETALAAEAAAEAAAEGDDEDEDMSSPTEEKMQAAASKAAAKVERAKALAELEEKYEWLTEFDTKGRKILRDSKDKHVSSQHQLRGCHSGLAVRASQRVSQF